MGKHTPAPWKVFDRNETLCVYAGDVPDHNEVVHWRGFDASHFPKQRRANARLIAAAPDLLRALQKLTDCVSDPVGVSIRQHAAAINSAHRAISKAVAP